MLRQLHDGMIGAIYEAFAENDGMTQDYVLVPTLFSLMFSGIMMNVYRDERPGTDGHLDKTMIMHQQPSTIEYSVPRIRVNSSKLKIVDNLGSIMSSYIRIDDEVAHQISKVSYAFGRLQNSV
nr:unnamed protein product [Spirometra erinaceieuropaei]